MEKFKPEWRNITTRSGFRYKCGYCGADTAPSSGWYTNTINNEMGQVLICSYCNRPSFIFLYDGEIKSVTPSPKMGNDISGLPKEVGSLYDEARRCTASQAYTSAVLTCRKILMHVAVEKGAIEGQGFLSYVTYLSDNNYIPPDGKDWVDHIRQKANEANHEINIMSFEDADDLINFTEMLLRLVYEFKYRLSSKNK